MFNLTRFNQNELELFIDTKTGEAFPTISGYARMVGLSKDTVKKRLQRLGDFSGLKMTEIITDAGIRQGRLIPASIVFEWAIKDNPESLG